MERIHPVMDAEKSHPLLEQLLPLLEEPDFDNIFSRLTQGESNNTRFLLKMELKRLSAPCVRSIDLRARHNAISFAHSGIQHFMTPEDIEVFHAALTTYHGQYTLGVYEAVMTAQKERLQQDAQQEDDPQQGDQQLGDRDCQPNAGQAEEIGKQEQHRKNDGDAP